MTSLYDDHDVSTSGPSHLEPPGAAVSPPCILTQQIARDHSLLMMLTLQCEECNRHGAAKDGKFTLRAGGVVYCEACVNAEALA